MEKGEEDRLRGIAMRMLGYNNRFNSDTQDLGTLVSDTIRASRFREGVEHTRDKLILTRPCAEDPAWITRRRKQLVYSFLQQSGSGVLQGGDWKDQEKWEIDEERKLITVPAFVQTPRSEFEQMLYHGTRPELACCSFGTA